MSQKQTGRNDPCPCGSGRKYKKCCGGPGGKEAGSNPARQAREELQEAIGDRVFESEEEAQRFARDFMEQRNAGALSEFQGLSPAQMHRLLHFPFESPDIVQFRFTVDGPDDALVLRIVDLLVKSIGEKGIKPTATGNLPRAVSRAIAREYLGAEEYARRTRHGDFMSELDVHELHIVRLVAGLAGLISNHRGRFITSRALRTLLDKGDWSTVYEKCFHAFVEKINWAYPRASIEVPFFQQSFAFTLYLLSRFGDKSRPGSFYGDRFLEAFPMLLEQEAPREYLERGQLTRNAYVSQVLCRVARMLGLADCEYVRKEGQIVGEYRVKARPLLHRVVSFRCSGD